MTHRHILRLAAIAALAAGAGCGETRGAQFVSLPIDTDPSLATLTTSAGSLDPVFSPTRTAFNLTVPDSVSRISVTPTAAAPTSSIQVNGQDITNGATSLPITLGSGVTSIPVVVTAQNGAVRRYTISTIR